MTQEMVEKNRSKETLPGKGWKLGLISLYSPAIGLLVWQGMTQPLLSQKLLAIALLLLSLDLLKMAIFDLEQVAWVRRGLALKAAATLDCIALQDTIQETTDSRLTRFHQVTLVTIIGEVVGLYGSWGSLSWGAIGVLLSQVGFNLFAKVQLYPEKLYPKNLCPENLGSEQLGSEQLGSEQLGSEQLYTQASDMIQPFGIRDRALVLAADGLGIGLVAIGFSDRWAVLTSAGLLGLVLLYGLIKYQPLIAEKISKSSVN